MTMLDINHPCFRCEDRDECRAEPLIPEEAKYTKNTYGCARVALYEQTPMSDRKCVEV